jgi:hypothetical protein
MPTADKPVFEKHREMLRKDAVTLREKEKILRGKAKAHAKIAAKEGNTPTGLAAAKQQRNATLDADALDAQASALEEAVRSPQPQGEDR